MDPFLVLAAAALGGPLALVSPWLVLAVALGLGGLVVGATRERPNGAPTRPNPRGHALTALAMAAVLGAANHRRAEAAVSETRRALDRLDDALPGRQTCDLAGLVAASPTVRGDRVRVVVDGQLECEGRSARMVRVSVVHDREGADLARGDAVAGLVTVAPPELFHNPELGSPFVALARSGVVRSGAAAYVERRSKARSLAATLDAARAHVRRRIAATFEPRAAPLARALVLGEMDLDAGDAQAFRASGLSHLLAVSGMHLVLVAVSLERALAALLARVSFVAARGWSLRGAAALTIPVVWLYADFAGGSGSAVRAAAMLTLVLVTRASSRRSCAVRAFALSSLALGLVDPLAVFDLSLLLSLTATAGLLAFARPLSEALRDRPLLATSEGASRRDRIANALATSLGTTLAAVLPSLVILAGLGPTVPAGALLANLIAVPVGEAAALPVCLLHAIAAPLPSLEQGAAVVGSGALLIVLAIARGAAAVPWLTAALPPPTPIQCGAVALGLAAWVLTARGRTRAVVITLAIAVVLADEARLRVRSAALRVTALDVGQGDALLVELPDGSALLVDGGGLVGSPVDVGARVVAPVLRARRRSQLRAVVLSHPHPDHYGGLDAATQGVAVDEVWESGEAWAGRGAARDVIGRLVERGARHRTALDLCGTHAVGGAVVEVLAPCPSFSTERGSNDNSLVLRLTYGARRFLLAGDAEHVEEAALVARRVDLTADVLKVGHHGSSTSTSPAWLAAVRPTVGIISAGVRNRFGHPTMRTLETLRGGGVRVLRTDRQGQVTVATDGKRLDVGAAR